MRQHTGIKDRLATFLRGDAGGVVTVTALCLVVLVGMVGLAVDTGHLLAARNELQNAADAAAIAGARALVPYTHFNGTVGTVSQWPDGTNGWSHAQAIATQTVQAHKVDDQHLSGCQVEVGYWNLTWSRQTAPANLKPTWSVPVSGDLPAVKVTIDKNAGNNDGPLSMFFVRILGIATVPVRAQAAAVVPQSPDSVPEGCLFPMAIAEDVIKNYDFDNPIPVTIHDCHQPEDAGWWTTLKEVNPSNSYIKNLINGTELSPSLSKEDDIYLAPGVRASDFKEALDYKLDQVVLLPVVPGGDDWGTKDTRKITNFVGFMITGGSQGGKYLTGYFVKDCATAGAGGGGPTYGVLGGSPRLVN